MDGQLPLFSTGSNMMVQFKSNAAGEDKGFKLTFKIVKKSKHFFPTQFRLTTSKILCLNTLSLHVKRFIIHTGKQQQ